MAPGELRLTLGTTWTPIHTQHDDVEDVLGRGATAVIHDQTIVFGETRLEAELGLARGIAVGAMLPVRVVSTGITFRDAASGGEVALSSENIHHRDETLSGVGDPWLTLRVGRTWGGLEVGGQVGVTLPLGRTEEDPYRLGDMGLSHQHVQLGTGSVGLVAQLEAARRFGRLRASLWGLALQNLFENGKGYEAGDRYAAGIVGRVSLGQSWVVGGGVDVQGETAERWGGVEPTDDGNRGRVDVLVGAEASWAVAERVAIAANVKVPVVTEVVGGQLEYPVVVGVAVTARFGGTRPAPAPAPAPAHQHEHEHEHEHQDEDEDEELGVALVGEEGVVTVYDFWAAWCVPCKELDARLSALLARHPGKLVVKRVDVTRWEHLPFELPHLKVLGVDGKLAWERTGAPSELAAAVGGLLSTP